MRLNLNIRRGDSNIWFAGTPRWSTQMGDALSPTQAAARLAGRRVLLLLHGYRNTQDAAQGAYSTLLANFESIAALPYDVVICGYMPLSQFGLGFPFARMRAAKAGRIVAAPFRLMNLACLDIQTHSLGGMVALEMLRAGLRCRNLIMSAPAVSNNALEPTSRYGPYLYRAKRIVVAHSVHDPVDWPYRFASWDRMLGCSGPQEPGAIADHAEAHDFSAFVTKHSGYKECREYLELWRDVASAQIYSGNGK